MKTSKFTILSLPVAATVALLASPATVSAQGGPRGGIPNVTPAQTAALSAIGPAVATQNTAVTMARTAFMTATFAQPKNDATIRDRNSELGAAELALAQARAEQFASLQAGTNKLSAEQAAAFIAMGGRAGGAGGLAPTAAQAPEEGMTEFPVPPQGFNVVRADIPHGEVKVLEYDSKTLGIRRPLRVYTPPGYSTDRKYPVLYLQHGLGNISTFWITGARSTTIADNLIADGKMLPMIIVYPSGNATATLANEKQGDRTSADYGQPYTDDLLKEIIPFVESHYPVYTDRAHRALAGMSMGSGQALNIGLTHLDLFSAIAVVAPAPNTRPAAELVPDPAALRSLKLLWLSAGNRDGLLTSVSIPFHKYLQEKGVSHFWRVDNNAHDTSAMAANFYHYAQRLFKE